MPEQALPQNCEYYFNILTITVAVPVGTLQKTCGTTEFHDLSRLKDARPIYLYMYEDEDEECDMWETDAIPHTVVEVNTKTNEISWYGMIDFETERPWAIEPIEEDFDYDDDNDFDPDDWDYDGGYYD